MGSFSDRLVLGLSLTIGGDTFAIPGGGIKRLEIDLRTYGFRASVAFYVSAELEEDALFPRFTSRDAIRAALSVTVPELPPGLPVPAPLSVEGIVTEKKLQEIVGAGLAGAPVVLRRYELKFADAAAVLWGEHRPCELYTAATMKDVIESNLPEGVSVACEWDALSEERKMICVGLGGGGPSFHDFVLWFVREHHGVFEYDAAAARYRIGGAKKKAGDPVPVLPDDVEEVSVEIPETRRDTVRVVNPFAERAETKTLEQAHTSAGVRRDVLALHPIAEDFTRRAAREQERRRAREDAALLEFRRFPRSTFRAGDLVTFAEGWSARTRVSAKPYRVVSLSVSGAATGSSALPDADLEESSAELELEARAVLELASNPAPIFPEIQPPPRAIYVEGKIVSAGGGDDERTWLPIEDEKNGLAYYRVEIPLWNKKIEVPFEPTFWSGHLFFPAYKHERVLIALGFSDARISRFLDWAANARMPQESQGNRIVLGKRASDGTTMEHDYLDGKPRLRIQRTLGQDKQTLEISEGLIRLEVKEDATAQAVEPKYDVTLQVEAAKGQAAGQASRSVAEVTGSFEVAVGGVNTTLEAATADLEGALATMESDLNGRIDTVKSELDALASALEATTEQIAAAVTGAKAEIAAAVSG